MGMTKLQFRANRAGSQALDEPSLAVTYSITTVSDFEKANPDVRLNENSLAIEKPEVIEYDCDISDLCGVVIFGNGFFCRSA